MARADRTYTPFAFGPLNVAVPEHTVPDGTLRAVKNLIPLGPGDAAFWGAANPELQVGDLTGVLGITAHQRGRLGELSDLSGDPNQSHERLIEMTSSNIYVVDPGQSFAKKSIYAFSGNDPARKMQAAQLGEYLYLAISGTPPMTGVPFADRGFPEPVREIRDDEVLPLHLPDLPSIQMSSGITAPSGVTIERKLRRGRYPIRFAFRLKDGSYGPPGEPRILDIGIAVTTLNGAVAIGDSTFVVNSISNLFGAIYEAYKAGEDTTTAFVENERVTMASINVGTSTVTLATGTYFTQAHADASDVDTGRGYWVKFDLTSSVASPWEEIISGISVLAGQNVLNDEDGLRAPFYHVVEIEGITFNDEVYWSENNELIPANPLHDESILTMHEIGAAAVFVYNARLHLGDLSFNFRKPAFVYTNGQGGTPVRFGVRIETENGSFLRISDTVNLDSTTVSFENNLLTYPDIRATEFIIYYDAGSGFKVSHTFKPKKSNVINVSYLILDASITVAASGADMPNAAAVNSIVDRNPNRYIVSDVLQPRSLGADLVYEVGESSNDPIIGFAANTHAVSEGQYGDYPLIILSSETVSLAQVGSGSVPYVGIQRIANRGCVGRYAFTNYERLVFFAARDGVWALGPHISDDAISASIHYHYGSGDLFTCLTNDTCMGYYNDNQRGRREIWMGAGKLTFGYSPVHSTWFILDRERKDFHLLNGVLYGVSGSDDSRKTYDEGGSEDPIAVYLRTNRMTLGMPGVRKRIYRTSIRQTLQVYELFYRYRDVQPDSSRAEIISGQINSGSVDTVSHAQGLAIMPELELYGFMLPGQGLVSFAIEWAPVRRHTAHASVPTPADITLLAADVSNIAWDCSEGFNDDPEEIPEPPSGAPVNLWWMEANGTWSVRRAPINNLVLPWTPVFVGDLESGYFGSQLSVDEAEGWIFTEEVNPSAQAVINRRSLAWGTKLVIVTRSQSTNFIYSSCIHRRTKKVYWIQANAGNGYTINRCNYDGLEVETVGAVSGTSTGQGKCLSIDQSGKNLYWHHSDFLAGQNRLKRLTLSTGTITDLNTSFILSQSGDAEEGVVDETAGTVGKLFFNGVNTGLNEGIYEIDLATPTVTTYISALPVADNQAIARDRVNKKIYYIDRNVLDDIYRMDDNGANGQLVISSTTGDDVVSIDLAVD